MTQSATYPGDVYIGGNLQVAGTSTIAISRSSLATDSGAKQIIPIADFGIWDGNFGRLGAASSDDLGIVAGTFGTSVPTPQTSDQKANGAVVTQYARFLVQMPDNYVSGSQVYLEAVAGMLTTVADTSATIDFEAYLCADSNLKSGSDLVTTAAQSINSLTFAAKSFTVTSGSLIPGSRLDVRVAIAIRDNASATAVTGCIAVVNLIRDVRG